MAHILVVDDERSICELLEITFRKEGHRVEVAMNGEAARRRLESQIFDIVISDIRMPDTTGVELLRFCKEISPSSYFLLITGVPTVETAIAAINAGADRYVIKDHDLVDQLRRAVRQVDETLRLKSEAGYLRRELRRLTGQDNIIGHSAKDARHLRHDFDRRAAIQPRVDHRGNRHGKGTRGARDPRKQFSRPGGVHHRQLRSVSGNLARIRVVRLHERGFYRRK